MQSKMFHSLEFKDKKNIKLVLKKRLLTISAEKNDYGVTILIATRECSYVVLLNGFFRRKKLFLRITKDGVDTFTSYRKVPLFGYIKLFFIYLFNKNHINHFFIKGTVMQIIQ